MKMKMIFVAALVLMLGVGSSYAAPGWAGLQWPNNGSSHLPTANIDVYVQIWDNPCTYDAGQCAYFDQVWMDYKKAGDPTFTAVLMTWNSGHVSSNDEYMATIPESATEPGINMVCQGRVHDTRDDSWTTFTWEYVISAGTVEDITVTFRVDMNSCCADFDGGVYFTGSHTGWTFCQFDYLMADPELDGIWEGSMLFPAGSARYWEYKFQRNDGLDCHWSTGGNFNFTLVDGSPTQVLDIQTYPRDDNWGPGEITAAGSFCAGLGCNENWIRLNTVYGVPTISSLTYVPGCNPANTDCDNEFCEPGFGEVLWDIRQGGDMNYFLVMSLLPGSGVHSGCFCITIDQILPVELIGFDAIAGDEEVTLSWRTASEAHNDYFSIVRDGVKIAEVNASGNAAGSEYTWTDANVRNGVTYEYTLVNVDVDGSEQVIATESATPSHSFSNVAEYALAQNYPNPFNPSTSISFSLKEAGLVNINVYDVTGRLVATLVNGVHEAGSHSIEFNAAGLPSGIYMYRMEAGDFSAVQKMVLMK